MAEWGHFSDAALADLRALLDQAGYLQLADSPWFGMRRRCPLHDRWIEGRRRQGDPVPLACHSRPSRFFSAHKLDLRRLQRLFWQHENIEGDLVGLLEEVLGKGQQLEATLPQKQKLCERLLEERILEVGQGHLRSLISIAALPARGSAPARYVMSSIPHRSPGEFVYLGDDTGLLLDELRPRARGQRLLDICCGGGGLSLGLGPSFTQVVGVDLNPTAVALAGSNARLNGCSDDDYRVSDLFSEVEGRFDWIVGNPPALPLVGRSTLFAYGGAVSTELTIRLVNRLPNHLNPGGQALLLTFSPGDRLWEELRACLPSELSLLYRVRARYRLNHSELPLLDHVFVEIKRDGQGTRRYFGPSWSQRSRQWSFPWTGSEPLVARLP